MKVFRHESAWAGVTRMIHAHNALVTFKDHPFTLAEFGLSVNAVLHGEASQL